MQALQHITERGLIGVRITSENHAGRSKKGGESVIDVGIIRDLSELDRGVQSRQVAICQNWTRGGEKVKESIREVTPSVVATILSPIFAPILRSVLSPVLLSVRHISFERITVAAAPILVDGATYCVEDYYTATNRLETMW